jgi:hypothetical protein
LCKDTLRPKVNCCFETVKLGFGHSYLVSIVAKNDGAIIDRKPPRGPAQYTPIER